MALKFGFSKTSIAGRLILSDTGIGMSNYIKNLTSAAKTFPI